MSTPKRLDDSTDAPAKSGLAAKIGSLLIALGLVFMVAGAVTWFQVRSQLVDEQITVAQDADMFGGNLSTVLWTPTSRPTSSTSTRSPPPTATPMGSWTRRTRAAPWS